MKPRLPHRLIQALLTISAAALSTTLPAFAEVPEGYTPVTIDTASQLSKYTSSDYIEFIIATDITDSAYRMTGEHQYWTNEVIETSCSLSFSGLSSSSYGGALSTGATLTMTEFSDLAFAKNKNAGTYISNGGAIYGSSSSTLTLMNNGSVTFNENQVSSSNRDAMTSSGGALYGGSSSIVLFDNNNRIVFNMNAASATLNSGVNTKGGAIYVDTSSMLNLTNNNHISLTSNKSISSSNQSFGGSLYVGNKSNVTFENNGNIDFNGNEVKTDYRVYHYGTYPVSIIQPAYAYSYGGGIYGYGNNLISLIGNDSVTFRGNWVQTSSSCNDAASYAYAYGGAIYVGGGSSVTISDNTSVAFKGNYSSASAYISSTSSAYGGAIYSAQNSTISIERNGNVEFRGNYEHRAGSDTSGIYRLRSIYNEGSKLSLSARENQSIVFYDTLYSSSNALVEFNASYKDNDVTHRSTGDILFSGKYVKEDLTALKSNYTQQELTNSLTSEVYATTNLYGGRLRIEDGAIYKGNGINVAADSAATLRLDNGTLNQTGYNVEMHAGTTLDLEGENSITASTLRMMDGSTLSFNLGSQEGALLSLNGILNTGKITIALSGDMQNAHELINLADVSQYDTTMWTEQRIAVSGTNFKHLVWDNGILSYTGIIESHIELDNDKEITDFDGGDIVDIEGNKHKLTVKHPVDLVHLAMKDGVVRLEGADNNVVRITLTEDGTLELAAGAGLNVGNIVSMVANGSADLEISGDIEISDIKAYGKPGNKGTLSYVNMTTAGDYTIENMTITGSVIDVGEGTTLYLVNVDIKSDTHITDDPASVFVQGTHADLDGSNTWVDKRITTAENTTLYLCGDTAKSITLAAGTDIVELTSDMFDTVTLTGTDLWLDMTAIAGLMPNTDYITLQFKKLENALVDVENLKVYATIDGETYRQAYAMTAHGTTTTLYFNIPEPTSSTLSLLALASLCMRRRRK